jgi:hypothetical protein
LAALFELSKVKDAHPHRFRDTFAVELLLSGVPIERVSILLGHQSVRITERHYAPWVRSRQEQLEADLANAWKQDPPIALQREVDASHTTLKVKGWGLGYGMDWNPDGKSLWVQARTSKGVEAIVNVDLQGNVTPLFEDAENRFGWAVPSPDGSRVAYYKLSCSSNVWLLRDF